MPFTSLCKSFKINQFAQKHFKTAIRLSAKLSAKQNSSKEELQK